MTFPNLSLPARPLSINSNAVSLPRHFFLFTPVIFAITIFMIWWQAPDLLRDYQISRNPVVLQDGDIQDGKCTTRKAVMTDCEAKLSYTYQGRAYQTETHFFFVDIHTGDYLTDLVISADHPELATLSLGLEKLWNRVISLVIVAGILAVLSLAMVFLAFRVWRVRAALRRPAGVTLIPVDITTVNRSGKRQFLTYVDKLAADRTKRTAYTMFSRGEDPLVLADPAGKAVGIAARHGRTALPVLLDAGLERIDLSPEERTVALASVRAAQAETGVITLQAAARKPLQWMRGLKVLLGGILLVIVAGLGYWAWYVTTAPSQFDQIGMQINNILPKPMNDWGCGELKKRFGNDRAPYGCAASDYTSWK
ncbi:hypothetical protein [Neorhizobium sp. NCHU2750]|uniref:hypothetical protein n=1 Tax=Neorhizobium sp. NCHU2750 TaxID=1825976 RepID=UPI000E76C48F|nr:membrane protein [Neorhizobium sp. NCHU2750]